jgi:hypothetical protein
MRLTTHAERRIRFRTHTEPKDIILLLENKLSVVLGENDGYTFSLFYSQKDGSTLIAVTAGTTLVSVWHQDYRLPHTVQPVTPERVARARQLYQSFVFQKCVTPPTAISEDVAPMYRAIIAVRDGDEIIFTKEVDCLASNVKRRRENVLRSLQSELQTIESIVRAHAHYIMRRVTYLIDIIDTMGGLKRSLIVTRGEIAKLELPQTT